MTTRPIVVAGAGIAGLTAALALARQGFDVRVYEREAALNEAGAGIQLSPNATRILARLGVLEAIAPSAVEPHAVVLKRAAAMAPVARVRLGAPARERWGAPYLVTRRADLQGALLNAAANSAHITLVTGTAVETMRPDGAGAVAQLADGAGTVAAPLVVAADGVWSRLAAVVRPNTSRFTGHVAWRTTLAASRAGAFAEALEAESVTAFMHPRFHLVAYPVDSGRAVNLVAVMPGAAPPRRWGPEGNDDGPGRVLAPVHPALAALAAAAPAWAAWPIHAADADQPWTHGATVLIGDAAHAMAPFAAQGAAMAIEDAAALAQALAHRRGDSRAALEAFAAARRPRVKRVARRGAFNRFAWHARQPVAGVRDLILKRRSEAALMADFDWLYGRDAETEGPGDWR